MRTLLFLFSLVALIIAGCGGHLSPGGVVPPQNLLRIISDVNTSTNDLIHALRELQATDHTNEPPEFWCAIANSTNYSVDHRRRAVLQLFGRHFKPGMTLHQIALLLNHPTWTTLSDVGFFRMGAPPPGGDQGDRWGWISILSDKHQSPTIWFRFRAGEWAESIQFFQCLLGDSVNPKFENIKIIGIVSDELLPHYHRAFNKFGITDGNE